MYKSNVSLVQLRESREQEPRWFVETPKGLCPYDIPNFIVLRSLRYNADAKFLMKLGSRYSSLRDARKKGCRLIRRFKVDA